MMEPEGHAAANREQVRLLREALAERGLTVDAQGGEDPPEQADPAAGERLPPRPA